MKKSERNSPFTRNHRASRTGYSLPLKYAGIALRIGLVLILGLITNQQSYGQWVQLGMDIDGEAAGDLSGQSVSLSSDGLRLAIGAPYNDDTGIDAGHVRVYEWDGTVWMQLGEDIDGEAAGDQSGHSVSFSSDGNRLAIGAPAPFNASSAGHVRVYEWDGTVWTQLGEDIDGEAAGDQLGFSVSLSSDGNRLAIGAPAPFNASSAGHVRVYEWDGTVWTQLGEDIDGEAALDQSGWSVSLSSDGSWVAIGAPRNGSLASGPPLYEGGKGHTRVYEWNGTAWAQLGEDIDGEAALDQSGFSVSLSSDGSRVAIGAPVNDGTGLEVGHVRVYEWDGTVWTQLGADIDGEATLDYSGSSVCLSSDGNWVAIGAPENDGSANNTGHVRIYEWDDMRWAQLDMDIDGLGYSVSFSSDGNRLAIGARGNDDTATGAGHVRVYELDMGGDGIVDNIKPLSNMSKWRLIVFCLLIGVAGIFLLRSRLF